MNVYLFPYDLQTCSLIIGSWSQSYEQTYLVYVGDLSSNSFIENSIWSLQTTGASVKNTTRLSTKTTVYTSDIYFQATVKRKPLYYMINNVYPTIILNIITLFTYFFPFAQQSVLSKKFIYLWLNFLLFNF